jgi:hypothetical protein
LTVFSAPNYKGLGSNNGSYLTITKINDNIEGDNINGGDNIKGAAGGPGPKGDNVEALKESNIILNQSGLFVKSTTFNGGEGGVRRYTKLQKARFQAAE